MSTDDPQSQTHWTPPSPDDPRAAVPHSAEAPAQRPYSPDTPPTPPGGGSFEYPPQYPPRVGGPEHPRPAGQRERRRVAWYVPLIGGCLVVLAALIALSAVLGGFIAVVAWQRVPASATVTRTLAVSGVPAVQIRDTAGNVKVVAGGAGLIVVQATKRVNDVSASAARRDVDRMAIAIDQSGDTVTVDARPQTSCVGFCISPGCTGFCFAHRTVDLLIAVPSSAQVGVALNAGNLEIDGIAGAMSATVNAGNATLRGDTLADASALQVNAGNLEVSGATFEGSARLGANAGNVSVDGTLTPGASLDVNVNAGNATLTLPSSTSAHLDATVDVGKIEATGWPINVSSHDVGMSASGDLGVHPASTLTIHVDVGNIVLSQAE
jgi:hypothetical protein